MHLPAALSYDHLAGHCSCHHSKSLCLAGATALTAPTMTAPSGWQPHSPLQPMPLVSSTKSFITQLPCQPMLQTLLLVPPLPASASQTHPLPPPTPRAYTLAHPPASNSDKHCCGTSPASSHWHAPARCSCVTVPCVLSHCAAAHRTASAPAAAPRPGPHQAVPAAPPGCQGRAQLGTAGQPQRGQGWHPRLQKGGKAGRGQNGHAGICR
jgi:hypothetical protein